MSLKRLRGRVASATCLGRHVLRHHDLRFHKSGADGSAKCDAFHTGREGDVVHGVLYDIDPGDKELLDAVEGLGHGYAEKVVSVLSWQGDPVEAVTYIATQVDVTLRPYSWYVNHVLLGAREASLPAGYIDSRIEAVEAIEDSDRARDERERAIHR